MADMPVSLAKADRYMRNPGGTARVGGWLRGLFARLSRDNGTAGSAAVLWSRFLARQIATDLPSADGGRIVLLSSSIPQASSNEAVLMFAHAMVEELGHRVLLVDGTFSDAGVGTVLARTGDAGLFDFVRDPGRAVADLIKPTTRQNIDILPVGRTHSGELHTAETARVMSLYEQLKKRFDYVLVQQGPIILDPRYLVFAAKADVVLVLVEEGVTQISELDRCLDTFSSHQVTNVRLVLCAPR